MRLPTTSLAAIMAAMFACAPAIAQDSAAPRCRPDGTQQELNQCAHDKFAKADVEMNRLYKVQMSHLDAPRKKLLQASQRAWLQYRDTACLYETGPREESGSIWPLQNAECRAAFTGERNRILKTYVACRQDGCPN